MSSRDNLRTVAEDIEHGDKHGGAGSRNSDVAWQLQAPTSLLHMREVSRGVVSYQHLKENAPTRGTTIKEAPNRFTSCRPESLTSINNGPTRRKQVGQANAMESPS